MSQEILNIDILRTDSDIPENVLVTQVWEFLQHLSELYADTIISIDSNNNLKKHVKTIIISNNATIPLNPMNISYHLYKLFTTSPEIETLEISDESDETQASNHWLLPSIEFEGLWESLVFEENIKNNLLKFVQTIMLFSEKNIDQNILQCNRLALLHGPPGTGKTSLCRAMAQKISVRLQSKYRFFHLIEINSHSLFSKWFSESGKLVMKLFSKIKDIVEHKDSFVFVLIDEVESIAYARDSVSSNEPSDSLRVVNAVLTQLDQIRKYQNVLILATSNITKSIDAAFIDRADIVQYIGNPSENAIFEIYKKALIELHQKGIITDVCQFVPYDMLKLLKMHDVSKNSMAILELSKLSIGLSGRVIRKMPIIAHAFQLHHDRVTIEEYIYAMRRAILAHVSDKQKMHNSHNMSALPTL